MICIYFDLLHSNENDFILHFNEGNLVPLSTIIIATTFAAKTNLSVLLVAKNGAQKWCILR
jgi:hypothetical protein